MNFKIYKDMGASRIVVLGVAIIVLLLAVAVSWIIVQNTTLTCTWMYLGNNVTYFKVYVSAPIIIYYVLVTAKVNMVPTYGSAELECLRLAGINSTQNNLLTFNFSKYTSLGGVFIARLPPSSTMIIGLFSFVMMSIVAILLAIFMR